MKLFPAEKLHRHKRLTIKARVTLWYTVFMVVLAGLALCVLLFMSRGLSERRLELLLKDSVSDTVSSVHFRRGSLETEDLDFYRSGVSLFLYDTSGRLIAPKVNLGLQVDSLLQDQRMRIVGQGEEARLVYDLYAVSGETGFWVRGILSLEEAGQAFHAFPAAALILFPLFVLLAALGGYRITRSAFSPIGRMADTAEQISSGEDLSLRIETEDSRDELSRLSVTLNRMLARLEASFDRERQFTADVSHELRTPLSVIRAQCDFALSPEATKADKEEALLSISRQSARMSNMASQLLLLSRADRGVLVPEKKKLDFSALVRNACEDLLPAAEAEGLSLTAEIEEGLFLTGDETLLHRLVTNLLVNAIRYNQKGGSITLKLHRDDEASAYAEASSILLSVQDSGIGISKEDLDKIWQRFYRADPSRHSEGSGLGLSMVQWIAKVHGADSSVESTPGKGSCFQIRFPMA